MDALVVLFLILVGVRLLGVMLYLQVSRAMRRSPDDAGVPDRASVPDRRVGQCLAPVMALPPEPPRSAESDLYEKLTSGAISRLQYRDLMAALAVRDDEHHRLKTPLC